MIRNENWSVALTALRGNMLRTILTMLGVAIGSASIVLVVTVSLTGRRLVIAQIESVGSNLVWAEYVKQPPQITSLAAELTLDDIQAIKYGIPQVREAAGIREIPVDVIIRGAVRPTTLVGVTEGFQAIRNVVVLRGRYFDKDDMDSRSKVCLITKELNDRIYPNEDPIGKRIHLGELTFTIIGVFKERAATYGLADIQPESALIPFSLMKYYTGEDIVRIIYASARAPEDVPSVTRQVEAILKGRHPPSAIYNVQNLGGILEAAQTISRVLSVVLVVIAFIALLISGIGIMNIMLVTVTERTKEIGLRKSVGAARNDILGQFLFEALMLSGFGAVAGILIGVSIPVVIQPLLPSNMSVPISWISVLVAFGVSAATGILFGYLPASKAARLTPTDALRYE